MVTRDLAQTEGVQVIERPRHEGRRLRCPRCAAALWFDGDELICVLCGYEW